MNCPHCATVMEADREHRDFACFGCGLAGPRDVLEELALARSAIDASNGAYIRGQVCGMEACAKSLREVGIKTSSETIRVVVNGFADAFEESAKSFLARVKSAEALQKETT